VVSPEIYVEAFLVHTQMRYSLEEHTIRGMPELIMEATGDCGGHHDC
jgi:hypothetical protein